MKTFRMIYDLTGFSDVRIFSLFLVMTTLWRHFLSQIVYLVDLSTNSCHKFVYLVDLSKGYEPEMFQCCKLSGSNFTKELQIYSDDIIIMSLNIFEIWSFHILVNPLISYQSAKFQVFQLSESNFTEVSIRHLKTPLWRHYDVTSQYLVLKIAHFVEISRRYHLAKFHWPTLSGSNFMRAGGKHSPLPPFRLTDLHALRNPVLVDCKRLIWETSDYPSRIIV